MKGNMRCANSSVDYLRVVQHGKVEKNSKKEVVEPADIKACLDKLQALVPFTPKNKKLSTLEVVSYVIDYIQDLRETLGLPPSASQNEIFPLDEQFLWSETSSSLEEGNGETSNLCCHTNQRSVSNRQPFHEISTVGGNVSSVLYSTKVVKPSPNKKYLQTFPNKCNGNGEMLMARKSCNFTGDI